MTRLLGKFPISQVDLQIPEILGKSLKKWKHCPVSTSKRYTATDGDD